MYKSADWMRFLGTVAAIVGIVWCIFAFNISTSIEVGGYSSGREVHNLDLAERRQTHLMLSSVVVIIGTMLFGFGTLAAEKTGEGTRKCPACAESIKSEALKCRYCGTDLVPVSDLSNIHVEHTAADLQLMEEHDVRFEKNQYFVDNYHFDTLVDALQHAMVKVPQKK